MKTKSPKGDRFLLRFHEGYKGKERPRSVLIGNREFKIEKIIERKRVCDRETGRRSEIFTCDMEGKRVKIIVWDSDTFEILYL